MLGIFLDQETTGLDAQKHHVIEIAFQVIDLPEDRVVASYESVVRQPYNIWQTRDKKSIEVNGFDWEMIQKGKPISVISHEIIELLAPLEIERGKSIFICQNPAFDRGFFTQIIDVYTQEKLNWPYHWLDLASMYWTSRFDACLREQKSFPKEMNLSKDEIAKFYDLPPEKKPHKAMNGVEHLILCYRAIFSS